MTLDETITLLKFNNKHISDLKNDDLQQIAEWLEDYKHIKQWRSDVMDSFCKYDCNSIEEVYKSGYKKALFDIKAKMKEINNVTKPIEGVIENGWGTRFIDLAYINKISEQLKKGITND